MCVCVHLCVWCMCVCARVCGCMGVCVWIGAVGVRVTSTAFPTVGGRHGHGGGFMGDAAVFGCREGERRRPSRRLEGCWRWRLGLARWRARWLGGIDRYFFHFFSICVDCFEERGGREKVGGRVI